MVEEFNILLYDPDHHYKTVAKWWQDHDWPVLPTQALPVRGMLVVYHEQLICAGWMYDSDSSIAWVEWVTSNPGITDKRLVLRSLQFLIESLSVWAFEIGKESVFTSVKNPGLIRIYEKLGFLETDTGMVNLVKIKEETD